MCGVVSHLITTTATTATNCCLLIDTYECLQDMAKGQDAQKKEKKAPTKTPKEKKAEKLEKKAKTKGDD